MSKKRSLQEYLSLEYTVMLKKGEDGYEAWHPEFGRWTAMGVGDTPAEALAELDAMRRSAIEEFYGENLKIPEPAVDEDKEYSGQLVLRLPRSLHKHLAETARIEGTSLNQYLLYLLSLESAIDDVRSRLKERGKTKSKRAVA
ncbi:type II toxin-antitoxin system HicB family antitoxin [bacterium]|nr:type II toxin-antitoxin system HicB family antitoxin [bacterium]